ncbi:hypothetical protein QFZ76_000139 [Streptomyces sp. V4I2]|nr:hypothetical protein [Streptomyces sp. V4I2]
MPATRSRKRAGRLGRVGLVRSRAPGRRRVASPRVPRRYVPHRDPKPCTTETPPRDVRSRELTRLLLGWAVVARELKPAARARPVEQRPRGPRSTFCPKTDRLLDNGPQMLEKGSRVFSKPVQQGDSSQLPERSRGWPISERSTGTVEPAALSPASAAPATGMPVSTVRPSTTSPSTSAVSSTTVVCRDRNGGSASGPLGPCPVSNDHVRGRGSDPRRPDQLRRNQPVNRRRSGPGTTNAPRALCC